VTGGARPRGRWRTSPVADTPSRSYVWDASILLGIAWHEPKASPTVLAALWGSTRHLLCAVNLAEVWSKIADNTDPDSPGRADAVQLVDAVTAQMAVVVFDRSLAAISADLRPATRHFPGMGLADRACLATALVYGLTVLTADREWANVDFPGLHVVLSTDDRPLSHAP